VLVNSVPNGKLYTKGSGNNLIHVMHLYGTPYEKGKAHGLLLKAPMTEFIDEFFDYVGDMINSVLDKLPKFLQDAIDKYGPIIALDITYELTKPYTPAHFEEELQGLADGSGIELMQLKRIQMFPELIKAACTIVGSWSSSSKDGHLHQLRALDFGLLPNPMWKYPMLAIYHQNASEPGQGHSFASLSWFGMIGSVTAYSPVMGISEKVYLSYNGTASRSGIPFHYLMRDIVNFDSSLQDAENRINTAHRTCSVFLGIGSPQENAFRACFYGHDGVPCYDDQDYPYYLPEHPLLSGTVYIDKHMQPSRDPCLGAMMEAFHGNMTAELFARQVVNRLQTGDIHIAAYDYHANVVYVAIAGADPANPKNVLPAHQRQFFQMDMTKLFALE
jgi:hypothetical protein